MKKILYIYSSNTNKVSLNNNDDIRLYCLNIGKLTGSNITSINDHKNLNKIATDNVNIYSEFIFQKNSKFIENNLIYKNKLSLYFLTDLSCKRSEMFDTYSNFCNALFIKDYLAKNHIDKVIFDGCNIDTVEAISSVLDKIDFRKKNIKDLSRNYKYNSFKNIIFFMKLAIATFLNKALFPLKNLYKPSSVKELFLTRYPLHLDENLYEDKYTDLVDSDGVYLVNLFTDGLHQNLSLLSYLKAKRELSSNKKVKILDDYLSIKNILSSFIFSFIFINKLRPLIIKKYTLCGVDLTSNIKQELYFSMLRVPRLLMWEQPLVKFLELTKVERAFYYLHEYSYGRMFTFFFKALSPMTETIGFQHGPSSLRKMVYMTASNELDINGNGILSFPTPNKVLAEDEFSKKIYVASGYHNVKVMNKIYRLNYLDEIDRSKSLHNHFLIAPGLHDGEFLMLALCNKIESNKNMNYILKVHPRANNKYIENFRHLKNLNITNASITEVLSIVDKVYATYSSVAIEANYLGIDVEIIEIPGKINESPLIDKNFFQSAF